MTHQASSLYNRLVSVGVAAFVAFAIAASAQTTTSLPVTEGAAPVVQAVPPPPPPPSAPTIPTEETPAQASAPAEFTVTPAEKTLIPGVAVDQNAENPDLISIALDNVPLEDVVRLFTRISGANIIATTSNLQGTVTVNLKDVAWRPALSSILDMHGLTLLEKTPGTLIFSITPKPIGAPEPMVTETMFLKYAGVSGAVAVVRALLPIGASVSPYTPANALVIRSTETSISEIRKIVEKIDTPRQQVFIEAKFIELNDQAIEDLGVNWQVLESFGVSATGLKNVMTENTSKTKVDSQGVLGMQEKITTRGRRLANDTPIAGSDLGTEVVNQHLLDSKLNGKNITDYKYDPATKAVTWTLAPTYDLKQVRTAVLSIDDVKLALSALKQTDGATVVSNPKIIVANEETATIHIGSTERPFISTVTPGTQNTDPIVTYNPGEPVDLGVKVRVTPTINTERSITVNIVPELTSRLEDAIAPNGQTYPIISTKKIETIFSLESGKTAAIGGLTETTNSEKTKKIPLLGDIPLIGKYLFSYSHKEKDQVETIIFVTVSLANPDNVAPKEGIPEDSALVHKYLLKHAQEKNDQDKEIRLLEQAQKQALEGTTPEPKKGFMSRWFGH